MFVIGACTLCVIAVAAVLAWYFTSRGDGSETASTGTVVMATTTEDPSVIGGPTSPSETSAPGPSGSSMPALSSTTSTSPGATSTSVSTSGSSATTSSSIGPTSTATTAASGTTVYEDAALALSFQYPRSWTEFSIETVSELTGPPTSGFAVGDPQAPTIGGAPADYIFFGAFADSTQSAPPARTAMEEWAAMIEPENPQPLTTIEPLTDFVVNGVAGASKTYSLEIQGRPLVMRVCFLSAGTCVYVFTFRAEEPDWDSLRPLFDQVLNSFSVVVAESAARVPATKEEG